ncbi:MAG: SAM-dependent methyltransferase [Actinocatenispora sp.]
MLGWREATQEALYGPRGFFTTGAGPAGHFRTSVHAGPLFAAAVSRLLVSLDVTLGHPDPLDVVDLGAGWGELLRDLASVVPAELSGRLRLTAVERSGRPDDLPARIDWRTEPPRGITGLLVATEWLDNVPVDVAECGTDGTVRQVLVDPSTGVETAGPPVTGRDADWLRDWWPLTVPGDRAEIGWPRDHAWAGAVALIRRGLGLAVDYGHRADARPPGGSLTSYRHGRQVVPVPDGSRDLTSHVAWDPLLRPGAALLRQRDALHALGVSGARPPLALAGTDPAGYLRALAAATYAAELTDPAGLGGHHWLCHPVGVRLTDVRLAGPGSDRPNSA